MSKPKIAISVTITIALMVIVVGVIYLANWYSPGNQLARARTLSEMDKFDALKLVRTIIRGSKGDFPDAQLLECQILLDLNRGREASTEFSLIHHPESLDREALCRCADKALAQGFPTMSGRAYAAAGDYVKKSQQRMKNLIYSHYCQHEQTSEDQILKLCREYSQLWPDDAYPSIVSAGLYSERNVPSRAADALREALKHEIPPGEKNPLRISLVQMSMLLGDLKTAREQCDILATSNLEPSAAEAFPLVLAELLLKEGEPSQALEVVEKLPESRAITPEVRALRGKCRYALEDYAGTISELTEAVRLNDFDQQSHYLLGQAYLRSKNQKLADVHLSRSQFLNDLTAQILKTENELRNDLSNRQLKLKLATLNDQRGMPEKAAAWRRGASNSQ